MHVLDGAIRYASVEGYKLDLGSMPADVLRRERPTAWPCDGYCLSSAQLGFESSGRSRCLPEIYRRKTFRGPLSSVAPGSLGSLTALVQFLDRVERRLGWQRRATHPAAIDELAQLAADVSKNRLRLVIATAVPRRIWPERRMTHLDEPQPPAGCVALNERNESARSSQETQGR
jgi:hypothetical protein